MEQHKGFAKFAPGERVTDNRIPEEKRIGTVLFTCRHAGLDSDVYIQFDHLTASVEPVKCYMRESWLQKS